MKKLSRSTKAAIKKHGLDKCLIAYRMCDSDGEGACMIGENFYVTTRQADAMINAGREYTQIQQAPCDA